LEHFKQIKANIGGYGRHASKKQTKTRKTLKLGLLIFSLQFTLELKLVVFCGKVPYSM